PDVDGTEIREKYDIGGKIVIGFIGTFGPWHGVEVLAKVIKPVIEKRKDVHFLIIGDGALMGDVCSIIEEDRVESFATLTGLVPQEEAPEYLAACDIFASPHVPNPDGTPFFGSPTKLFEFMAMSRGTVASNLDQIGEVLEHGRTAWLVRPGDVSDLANGIIKLVEDENLRTRLGENARQEVIEKYTWERNVEKVIERLKEMGSSSPVV
ncbi:glycosyltransferase, partial [Candidatus Poribacteria bacterium]